MVAAAAAATTNASRDEIKTAFRSLAKKYHPDKFDEKGNVGIMSKEEAVEKFKQINEANQFFNSG